MQSFSKSEGLFTIGGRAGPLGPPGGRSVVVAANDDRGRFVGFGALSASGEDGNARL